MLTPLKPLAEKAIQPLALLFRQVNPNVVTFFGMVFPALFFWFVLEGWYVVALVVFVLNLVDMLDGAIARQQNKVTAFGGFLDSTIDRFADFTLLAAFAFGGIVSWNIIAPLILLSYLISYIRSRTELAAKGQLQASVGIVERTERLVAVFAALALYALFPDFQAGGSLNLNLAELLMIVLSVFSFVTVVQRVQFAYKHLPAYNK
jgi:archaetidylinositol phosphate synthase